MLSKEPWAQGIAADSDWVRSAIDLHVHSGQDVVARLLTDEQAVREALSAGMRGLLIKSHARCTLDSCLELEARLGLRQAAFGSLVLNSESLLEDAPGVQQQIRKGIRVLYMPTTFARNAKNPLNRDGRRVSIVADGRLRPSLERMLETAAECGCTVATGHCDFEECLALIGACCRAGVRTVLVTHPEYFVTELSLEQQRQIAGRWPGVLFERTLYSVIDEALARRCPGTLRILPGRLRTLVRHVRALTPERTVLSSDLGQTFLPPPVRGFGHFLRCIAAAGISKADIDMMTKANPLRCLGLHGEMLQQVLLSAFGKHRGDFRTPFREPLLGWAQADDPLFAEFRTCASPNHMLPSQLLPTAASVLSIFLPFGEEVVGGNCLGAKPSEGWCLAYTEGNAFLQRLTDALGEAVERLGGKQAKVLAAHHLSHCHDPDIDPALLSSMWSQRHVAYACGLGTFGRNGLVITAKGCAGRFSSLVTDLPLPARGRPVTEHCLAKAGKACLRCVERCPPGALGEDGLDRVRCWQYLVANNDVSRQHGHAVVNVCGKCSAGVPCALRSPILSVSRPPAAACAINEAEGATQ